MANEEASGEKTEPASAHRREEAREKGNVARSQDITAAVPLCAGFLFLGFYGSSMLTQFMELTRESFRSIPAAAASQGTLNAYFLNTAVCFFKIFLPFAAVLAAACVISGIAQTGFIFSLAPLFPNFSKLNLFSGGKFKEVFSIKSTMKLLFSLIKLFIVFKVAYGSIVARLPEMMLLSDMEPIQISGFCAEVAFSLIIKVGGLLVILSLADYAFQKWRYEQGMMMTKQELSEEAKRFEGDPKIKARIRSVQMQLARKRMMQQLPEADVIITNPTHLAVAIKYDHSKMSAPEVIAKGARLLAEKIKKVAVEHHIPLVENRPLAQALFKSVEVGQAIPQHLYQAVAEILAYVYQLNNEKFSSISSRMENAV